MRFELVVKRGPNEMCRFRGYEQSNEHVTLDDLNRVVEVEQFLEKLFGFRFHLNLNEDTK